MRFASLVALLFWPAWGLAEELRVVAGAHPKFTRVVIHHGNASKPSFEKTENGLKAAVANSADHFETEGLFSRIDKRHLASVNTLSSGSIELFFACECNASIKTEAGMSIIDIAPRPVEAAETRTSMSGKRQTELVLPIILEEPALPEPSIGAQETEAALLEAELLRRLSESISGGVLSKSAVPGWNAANPGKSTPPSLAEETPDLKEETCPQPNHLALSKWAENDDFSSGLARLSPAIVDAAGSYDQAASLALARFYIRFGFGAEASQLLTTFDSRRVDVRAARIMAAVLESQSPPHFEFAQLWAGCDATAALWAILGSQGSIALPEASYREMVFVFGTFPAPLQKTLGGQLASRLKEAGELAQAMTVLRMIETNAKDPDPERELAAIRIRPEPPLQTAPVPELDQIVASESGASLQALIRQTEASLLREEAIPQETVDLLDSYRFQDRHGPEARRLADLAVRVVASSGEMGNAFSRLKALENPEPSLIEFIAKQVFQLESQGDFLRYAWNLRPMINGAVSSELRISIAERVLAIGLPSLAADYSEPLKESEAGRLQARIAIALHHADQVDALIAASSEEESSQLKAGMELGASTHLLVAGNRPDLTNSADLKTSGWQAVQRIPEPALSALGSQPQVEFSEAKPLASGRGAAENARIAADGIEALLQWSRRPSP